MTVQYVLDASSTYGVLACFSVVLSPCCWHSNSTPQCNLQRRYFHTYSMTNILYHKALSLNGWDKSYFKFRREHYPVIFKDFSFLFKQNWNSLLCLRKHAWTNAILSFFSLAILPYTPATLATFCYLQYAIFFIYCAFSVKCTW